MDRQLQYAFSDRADIRRGTIYLENYTSLYRILPDVNSYLLPYISPYTYLSELATHIIPTVIDTPYAIGLKLIAANTI